MIAYYVVVVVVRNMAAGIVRHWDAFADTGPGWIPDASSLELLCWGSGTRWEAATAHCRQMVDQVRTSAYVERPCPEGPCSRPENLAGPS